VLSWAPSFWPGDADPRRDPPMALPKTLYLASSNPGKLQEFLAISRANTSAVSISIELLPGFSNLPAFPEDALTFAENAAGKALHASTITSEAVCADDSGLVVAALGGAPGIYSARYAGPGTTAAANTAKLLAALAGRAGKDRRAYFACALAVARQGRVLAVITNRVDGEILDAPRGTVGFGYDPVFYFPPLGKAFAELSGDEKNLHSHRGKAFRRLLQVWSALL